MKRLNFFLKLSFVITLTFNFTSCGDDDSPQLDDDSSISAFVFEALDPDVKGTISGTNITATVPSGTDATSLVPTITIADKAKVVPASGVAQDFSNPVKYTVTAEDETETVYTVTVSVEEDDDSSISAFVFESFDPDVDGTISGTNIAVTVPYDADATSLTPTITIATTATVAPASGAAQDFSSPVMYTVTAEDGTTTVYTVTVTVRDAPELMASAVWEKTLANGGKPSWFTNNNDRDIAVGGNFVYVHNNNDKIRILSAADGSIQTSAGSGTGANKGFLDGKENSAGGVLTLVNVGVDDNGVIVSSNLRIGNGTNTWVVYNWDNNTSSQESLLSYVPASGVRMGDNMTIVGSVTGDGFIYAAGQSTNKIFRFSISGGTVNTTPTEITLSGVTALGNSPDVNPVSNAANANIIVAGTDINPSEYTSAGVLVGTLPAALNTGDTAPLFTHALDVKPFELSGRKVIATTAIDASGGSDEGWLYLIDYTDGWGNLTADNIIRIAFTTSTNTDKNLNATGGVDVAVNAAGSQATVYALISNFGIGAYNVTFNNL